MFELFLALGIMGLVYVVDEERTRRAVRLYSIFTMKRAGVHGNSRTIHYSETVRRRADIGWKKRRSRKFLEAGK